MDRALHGLEPLGVDLEVTDTDRISRHRFIVHTAHRSLPLEFQFEVRRRDGVWKVEMMWQTLPNGSRCKCFF